MSKFKELRIWQESMILAEMVYRIIKNSNFNNDYRMMDQLHGSSICVPSNIAEGEECGYMKNQIKYLNIAKGSAAELVTQLILSQRVGYIKESELILLENKAHKIIASIKRYIHVKKRQVG